MTAVLSWAFLIRGIRVMNFFSLQCLIILAVFTCSRALNKKEQLSACYKT